MNNTDPHRHRHSDIKKQNRSGRFVSRPGAKSGLSASGGGAIHKHRDEAEYPDLRDLPGRIHRERIHRELVPWEHTLPRNKRPHTPNQNLLLANLATADFECLLPHLELVAMPLDRVLYEADRPQEHIYFPTSSMVSLLYDLGDGAAAEIAVAGHEGVVSIASFMNSEIAPSRAVVRSAGFGYSIKAIRLKDEFERLSSLQHLLQHYTQALSTQMTQTAMCNRHHAVGQKLGRWLLLSLDRAASNELTINQEGIAKMLGVRRDEATLATGKLQAEGLINYRHGKITVLDRPKLEAGACECYAVVKREAYRLLSLETIPGF